MESIKIDTPYITLGQLLKRLDVIDSGGQAKYFLQEETVKVNGEVETRRGRKIYPRDQVDISGFGSVVVSDR
ncbi:MULTISPECIES: S4 domain-containing protein YaaA [Thermoactinomyces]|uniref:S4 domain-containing protein YaaA n=1 Tax=Thermoactinomyces vulgaris TaxID=2026 RepID=A0ABS0QFG7_THEVU|nr:MULTISPECIES: S4 domain-containing protein YaaA [Thermoactinomyces]KYQ86092.1 RNA-binding protein [Thermoactinomyces sp. AS95]MBA4551161.1 S4 domain-containing protein YaaA [Thermoactinomyces vulgaris]MBA4596880.1 S4 domain-containing protein YaaA [Thermoactinomyces vulgaris]MBH8588022.1 S4 domain-containing protein YaaA [Thermoactinomyces vulgaris]MBI0387099.1 S4 domain-containing protein YaaA [Thermoactinomyces sp. CICC 24227]